MNSAQPLVVNGRDGRIGSVDPAAQTDLDRQEEILIRLNNGQTILVPSDLMIVQEDGSYYLPMSLDQFKNLDENANQETLLVIPVITEKLNIARRSKIRKILVHKDVQQHEEVIDEPTTKEEVVVERVPVNRTVDTPPRVRYDGDTMVIPVLEEAFVVQKRLILKEEVRVTKRRTQVPNQQRVTLRAENVQVERLEPDEVMDDTAERKL